MSATCTIDRCDRPAYKGCRGWCAAHYGRWQRHGDPEHPVREPGRGLAARFWEKVETASGCWEWGGNRNRQGYGTIGVPSGGKWRTTPAHRVSWELQHGPIPDGLLVCHRCDNPPCIRPDHLFLGTHRDNAVDRERKGRGRDFKSIPHARGERVGLAKLTEQAVRQIRGEYARGGVSQQALADRYGVHQSNVSAAIRRETWKHVA